MYFCRHCGARQKIEGERFACYRIGDDVRLIHNQCLLQPHNLVVHTRQSRCNGESVKLHDNGKEPLVWVQFQKSPQNQNQVLQDDAALDWRGRSVVVYVARAKEGKLHLFRSKRLADDAIQEAVGAESSQVCAELMDTPKSS